MKTKKVKPNETFIKAVSETVKTGISMFMKHDGFVNTMAFLMKKGNFIPVPDEIMEIFKYDKEMFYSIINVTVTQNDIDAVIIVGEAWTITRGRNDWKGEVPSECNDRKDTVYYTIDTKDRQVSCFAGKNGKRLGRWKTVMDCDKTKPIKKATCGGLAFDMFGTSTVLGLPHIPEIKHVTSDLKID